MRRKVILWMMAVLMAAQLLCGCRNASSSASSTEAAEGSILVFYTNTEDNEPLSTYYALTSEGDSAISELFNILQNGQFSDGRAAVPSGVELVRSAWQEHSLVLYLAGEYPEVGTTEELLCRYALVETMSQLPDVEGVTIFLDEEPLTDPDGNEIGTMKLDSFLSDVNASSEEEKTIGATLYYADSTGMALTACAAELTENSTISLERQVVEKLIKGPSAEGCYASIPASTSILNVNVHDNICYVNLSSDFVDDSLSTSSFVRVYSLINSLTALDDVDYVQLMINGAADFEYSDEISFASPLGPDMSYVKQ